MLLGIALFKIIHLASSTVEQFLFADSVLSLSLVLAYLILKSNAEGSYHFKL